MEILGLLLLPSVIVYWCGVVSATTYDRSFEVLTDITTITIPSSTTQARLNDNSLGTNGIPQAYFSVSGHFLPG